MRLLLAFATVLCVGLNTAYGQTSLDTHLKDLSGLFFDMPLRNCHPQDKDFLLRLPEFQMIFKTEVFPLSNEAYRVRKTNEGNWDSCTLFTTEHMVSFTIDPSSGPEKRYTYLKSMNQYFSSSYARDSCYQAIKRELKSKPYLRKPEVKKKNYGEQMTYTFKKMAKYPGITLHVILEIHTTSNLVSLRFTESRPSSICNE